MGKICGSLILLGMLFDTFDAMVIGDGGSCCVKKTVGGVAYTLVTEEDTTKYGCKENCIYSRDDQPGGTQFCFKAGDLESVCNPDTEDQFLYLSDSRILRLPSFEEVACQQDFPEVRLRYASAGVVMDNNLLVCGGLDMTVCLLWTEDGWEEKGTGFNRKYAAASSVDGSLIITGGWDPTINERLASSMIYTEDAGWEEFTPLPSPTFYHCQVSVGDLVYIFGGHTISGTTDNTYKLSMSTKQWVKQSSLNTPRNQHGCAAWDGGVIVVGGKDAGGDLLSSVEKYNPVSNKWITYTPLPTPLMQMQVLVWDNDLYVFGGYDGNAEWSKKVFKLKHGEDTWEELGVTLQNFEQRSVFPAVTLSTIHCT